MQILTTAKLHKLLPTGQMTRLVSFKEFKKYHQEYPMTNCPTFERVIAEIDDVDVTKSMVSIYFDDGSSMNIFYDGYYERYNRSGKCQSTGGTGTMRGINWKNHHLQIRIYGKAILLERLVAVCCDIFNDTMPLSYNGLVANVMDGTGSLKTAEWFNCPLNIEPDNIEWCSFSGNSSHGWLSKQLYKSTHHVYRFSAEDAELADIVRNGNKQVITDYCNSSLYRVD